VIHIIAEIGINHNGSVETAFALMDSAKSAGANSVKFQKRDVNAVYTQEFLDSRRESPWGDTQRDQKLGLELTYEDYQQIDAYSRQIQLPWFASAWDKSSQHFLEQFDLPYNKIASAMLPDTRFLKQVALEKKHTFISTGMSTNIMIKEAVDIFRSEGCPFELMHCTSTYPMAPSDAHISRISFLRDTFQCCVGYSGHEVGLAISVAAAAVGASSIERHLTLDRSMYGSDQSASIEPEGFRRLVKYIRTIEDAMGIPTTEFVDQELPISIKLRQHLNAPNIQ